MPDVWRAQSARACSRLFQAIAVGRRTTLALALVISPFIPHLAPRTADPARSAALVSGPDLAALPRATVTFDPERQRLTVEVPVGDVPAAGPTGMYMRSLPVGQAVIPASGTIYSIATEVVDAQGHQLPRSLLHHVNLTDPTRRELFLPISLHIFAASKETPPLALPGLMLGLPLAKGQRLLVTGMVGNQTSTAYRGVRFRVILGYRPEGRLWPLWHAYPWVLDAMFPLGKGADGSKAFDLPPGVTVKSWEGTPAVGGYILGVGGHVHDYATAVDLTDVVTGQVIWHGRPEHDSAGRVLLLPVTRFFNWHRLGVRIEPMHRYRITVTYYNGTGHLLRDGGMGAVAGLFVPDGSTPWPAVDTTNALYRADLQETFSPPSDDMGGMMMSRK